MLAVAPMSRSSCAMASALMVSAADAGLEPSAIVAAKASPVAPAIEDALDDPS